MERITTVLLFVFVPQTLSTFKMLVTNGEPAIYSTYSNPLDSSATWDDCLNYCYNLGTCIVAYDDNCQIFEIGQISTATKLEGPVIAFKVLANDTADTCPVDDAGPMKGYYSTPSSYQPYNVTYDSPTWTFQTGPLLSCPSNFTLFVRDKGPWCMQVIQHNLCCNRIVANIKCPDLYPGSQLAGIENQAEYDWIVAQSIPIFQNVSGGVVLATQYGYAGVWLDGNRTAACAGKTSSPCNTIAAFQFSDPTLSANPQGFKWLSGQPDASPFSADGLVLRLNSLTQYGVDDTLTSAPVANRTDPQGCWKGYVCGIRPS